ncbi:MAG: T9SS type A sorting domain-containing protein [Lewinella sp.]|nr:T9SS type A sorting domain-containing protein [Lewinella sp.]
MQAKTFLLLLIHCLLCWSLSAQPPLVYTVEHTGAAFPPPVLPSMAELPVIQPLTDPFVWSDGSGRSTEFTDWVQRRAEIKAEIEHYEIGIKPEAGEVSASYAGNTLTVEVTVNGQTLTLTSAVELPDGPGPFPIVIGMGGPTGSLPADIFSSRGIARVTFNFAQVMAHTQTRGNEPINTLFPDQTDIGAYSAWPWGVSRLIDGLEIVAADLNLDLAHIGVTGCSFAGKMALFAGALDERIALTIAQESGGGGAAAWRVSETLGAVETLGATNSAWFRLGFLNFSNAVSKLPYDHHELMALVAPRALLVLGNPDYVWLADESGYVSCRAAHRVWEAFGVPERFGYSIVGGHGHCALPNGQRPEVEAFVDAFLLGDTNADTDVTIHPYSSVDHERWTAWWGTDDPSFPAADTANSQLIYFEPECATVGSNWQIVADDEASGGHYVTVNPAIESVSAAPTGSEDHIVINFTVEKDTTYYVFGRMNCPSANDDSFWIRVDDGPFAMINGLGTNGWEWARLNPSNLELTAGAHSLIIAYRENGALLDKIRISDYPYAPEGVGAEAINICQISTDTWSPASKAGFELRQNYPNPFSGQTKITFVIPEQAQVSLKVFSALGQELAELAGRVFPSGTHTVSLNTAALEAGVYRYALRAGDFLASRWMMVWSTGPPGVSRKVHCWGSAMASL